MEDYTSKYKGEQVELALFGGDYQDGVLTAYCAVDDAAHRAQRPHPDRAQNIASLHCTSRCDAPEPDWPRAASPTRSATTRPENSSQNEMCRQAALGGLRRRPQPRPSTTWRGRGLRPGLAFTHRAPATSHILKRI